MFEFPLFYLLQQDVHLTCKTVNHNFSDHLHDAQQYANFFLLNKCFHYFQFILGYNFMSILEKNLVSFSPLSINYLKLSFSV
jgi:hypothetical protein